MTWRTKLILTEPHPASADRPDFGAPVRDWRLQLLGLVSVVALWFICRPYIGVDGDARLYVGRVIADLDPRGVGLDLAFAHDGQSRFSIFPRIMSVVLGAMGVGPGAMAVTVASLGLWLAAAAALLSRLFAGRLLWASLVCVAVFPPTYGGFSMFEWGEAIATPRTLAEAFGLACLAMLLDGRHLAAFALALASAAIHPIMAVPVLAAALVFAGLEDRRWFLLVPAAAAAVVGAALLHLPIADRLFAPIDPLWLRIVSARNPQVFPALWPVDSWGPAACDAATVLLAGIFANGRLRRLLIAVSVAAVAGTIVAAVAPTELVTQLQLWRAQWLTSFIAAASFSFCAVALWRRGGASSAALAMLAIAWMGSEHLVIAAVGGVGAVALGFELAPRPFAPRWVWIAYALATLFALVTLAGHAVLVAKAFGRFPAEYRWSLSTWSRVGAHTVFFAVAAIAVAIAPAFLDRLPARALAAAATLVLVIAAALMWDDEPGVTRARVAGAGEAPLRAILTDGSVYWLDSSGTNWLWTGRPEWWTQTQGAGVIFDRGLALIWDHRLAQLIAAGLLTPADQFIYQAKRRSDPVVTLAGLSEVCRDWDGPRWVVAPVERVRAPALSAAVGRWRAPATEYQSAANGGRLLANRDYAVFNCAGFRPAILLPNRG